METEFYDRRNLFMLKEMRWG